MKKVVIAILLCLAIGCNKSSEQAVDRAQGNEANISKQEKIVVLTTTGIVASLVEAIAKDQVEIQTLMGPGVDPHLYRATQADLKKLTGADIIFYNGLRLEGKLEQVLVSLSKKKKVVALASALSTEKLLSWEQYPGEADPHIWFDLSLWKQTASVVVQALREVPGISTEVLNANAQSFQTEMSELHEWIFQEMRKIPKEKRILITAHDAFQYFGRAYGIEVRGLQGISTESEFGLKDLEALIKIVIDKKIPSVFVESSVPRKFIEALQQGVQARGQQVKIGEELYSDALGSKGSGAETYFGMVKHNTNAIFKGLNE